MLEQAKAAAKSKARGTITLCAIAPELGEANVKLPGEFPVTPEIKGALKSLQGVVMVEEE